MRIRNIKGQILLQSNLIPFNSVSPCLSVTSSFNISAITSAFALNVTSNTCLFFASIVLFPIAFKSKSISLISPVYRSGEEKDHSHRSGNHSFPQNPHLIEFWGTDYSACAGGFRRGPEAGGEGTAGLAERSLCPGTPRTAGGCGIRAGGHGRQRGK